MIGILLLALTYQSAIQTYTNTSDGANETTAKTYFKKAYLACSETNAVKERALIAEDVSQAAIDKFKRSYVSKNEKSLREGTTYFLISSDGTVSLNDFVEAAFTTNSPSLN